MPIQLNNNLVVITDDGEIENTGINTDSVIASSTGTLSAKNLFGSIINNYGQASANVQTLPSAESGMNFIAVIGTSGAGTKKRPDI